METTIKKTGDGIVELSVRLNKEELNGYIRDVEQRMAQSAEIPGFRKGKAPHNIVQQHLNQDVVRQAALEVAVSSSLQEALKEQNLDVAKSENLSVKENTAEGLAYDVTLHIFPAVELPDLSTIKIVRKPAVITDTEVQEAIDVIRNMRARFSTKESGAQTGDRVEVDFKVSLDGKIIEGGESKNHPLIIGGKNFIPGFEGQLVGMTAGQQKKFSLTAPADYYHKKVAGKKLDFDVTMNLVQNVELPELNDEFARGAGRFKDTLELQANVREGILQEKNEKEKERIRLEILDAVADVAKIKPPRFLVEEQLDSMVLRFDRDLHERGLELPMYLAQIGKTSEDLRKDWEKDAQRQAQFTIVLRAVAKTQKIQVDSRELDESVNAALQSFMAQGQADMQNINTEQLRERIEDRLIQEKTFDYLEKACVNA